MAIFSLILCLINVTNEKLMHMFLENPKLQDMHTRNFEKYEVQFAHTGRLQKYPLIYMQNLLNREYSKTR